MNRQQRSIGIDLFRGLAILAVAILHVDGGIKVLPVGWSRITDFALFAVPFFLALSFYLAIDKLYASSQPYPLRSRLARLLIPYSFWSAFYLVYKVIKYGIGGEPSKLANLFQDPLSLLCFGGTAFHLYFLPLLAVGTVLIKFLEWAISKKISLKGLVLLCLVSCLSYEILLRSGNEYQIGINQAFQPLLAAVLPMGNSNPILRLLLAIVACILRCSPYILVGAIFTHPSARKFRLRFVDGHLFQWLFIFIILNIFGSQILPRSLYEVSRGYVALFAAISFPDNLRISSPIKSLGVCSFGIYLIHLFLLEIFQSILNRIYPNYIYHASIGMMITAALIIVAISWAITFFLIKNKKVSRIIFG